MLQESWNLVGDGAKNPGSDHQTKIVGRELFRCSVTGPLALGYGLISKLLTNEYAGTINASALVGIV